MTTKEQHYTRLSRLLEAAHEISLCLESFESGLPQDIALAAQDIALAAQMLGKIAKPSSGIGNIGEPAAKRVAELCLQAFLANTDGALPETDRAVVRHIVRRVIEALRVGYKLAEGETELQQR